MSTTKCLNCGKDIETYKMVLHERFCSLNVRKCSICEEPVQIDEYNEHKILKHSEKSCEKCGKKFPASQFIAHLKSCSKKLIECQYCGLPMEPNEIKEHEYQCGGKTINCEFCKEIVTKANYDLHLQYTCKEKLKNNSNENNENKRNNSINKEDILKNEKKDLYKINEIISKNAKNNNNYKKQNKVGGKKRKRSSNDDDESYEEKPHKIKATSTNKKKKKK